MPVCALFLGAKSQKEKFNNRILCVMFMDEN